MAMSRSLGSSASTIRPLITIEPEVCSSRPAMIDRRVDLPQPEGPTRTRKSPSLISRLMFFRIETAP